MGECTTGGTEALAALQAEIDNATTIDAVLVAVVEAIAPCIPDLLRASVRLVADDDPTQVEIAALWSAVPTDLVVGLRMPVRSTSLPDVALSGHAEVRDVVGNDTGILDVIIRDEGVRSFVSLPLHHAERVVGLLSLSSAAEGAFAVADVTLLGEAADLVSARLAQTGPAARG